MIRPLSLGSRIGGLLADGGVAAVAAAHSPQLSPCLVRCGVPGESQEPGCLETLRKRSRALVAEPLGLPASWRRSYLLSPRSRPQLRRPRRRLYGLLTTALLLRRRRRDSSRSLQP
jgi:hypothetical protein